MHISFVILHYMTLEDTVECVESIQNNVDYEDYSIVIVDNGSKNNTGKILEDKYSKEDNIKVILNNDNLGFAKGNNIGFQYSKYKLNPDFIVMINNDTVIEQNEFCRQIINEYNNTKFDIAGPKIISLIDNKLQNPVPVKLKNKKDIQKKLMKFNILLVLNLVGIDSMVQSIKSKIKDVKNKENRGVEVENLSDYQLHGSCMIFSKNYIKNYEGLYEKTFMYCEEDILKYISQRDNLVMKYFSNIEIYHKEDSATNEILKKELLKRRFYYKYSINSCKHLIALMKEDE